ncbi:hypothetical protein EN837_04380 [bacterium M00.F.Ca.ET.194.01.1.1]|nr:hypothetical protein EN837_04380 [bacterium M00.F.Ca.ET.194.01.1.1]TGS57483.1 hypothetical protein EN822_04380 [bacterium M00.F.Ca.ET.179.01.1.1]TGV50415.1 hypothetical protein EN811_04380 [bacterium M00.F.Ca.ET.168.01.1.1]
MTDAKSLTEGFENSAREAAFRIAPERAQELVRLMGGATWYLDFEEGPANFTAYPSSKSIVGTYAALLSLWATAASVRVLMIATQTAAEQDLKKIVIAPGTPGFAAIEFKNAALALIRNEASAWVDLPANPDPAADLSTEDGLTNNLFLAALSFVVLHECGHITLGHQPYTTLLHEQEQEADAWAVTWVLKMAPTESQREFRMLAVCIAFAWIGLIDEVRRASTTHPPAAQRLAKAYDCFGDVPDDSLALEVSSYVIKAFFDPTTDIPQPDDALSAFVDQLIGFSRSS